MPGNFQQIKSNCKSPKKTLLNKPKCSPDDSTELEIPSEWFNSPMSEKNTNDAQEDDNEIDDTWFNSPLESTNDTQVEYNEIDNAWFDSSFSEDH